MGCNGTKIPVDDKNEGKEKERTTSNGEKEKQDNKENNEKKNASNKNNLLKINEGKKGLLKGGEKEQNKDQSNIKTEGIASDARKLNLKKNNYNGVVLMQGVEDCIPEDLKEEEIYQLVEDALQNELLPDDSPPVEGKLTKEQAKAISKILHKKLRKEYKGDDIDIKEFPELKGVNVRIGVTKLSKDLMKNMIGENDYSQIYEDLTKNNENYKALSIELIQKKK